MPKSVLKDLTGQRFGKLVVLERAPSTSYGDTRWWVRCDDPCGRETIVFSAALTRGQTKSCGQGHAGTHGQTGGRKGKASRTYQSWRSMIDRCFNPKRAKYADYGGRGITVCARWLVFENFYADMGDRPSGMSLEREDVDGNYEPGNCRWGTSREQSRNKRSTIVTFDDVQEIIGRFEHGEKRVSIARRFDIGAGYVGDIIRGKVWPEIDRPHRAHWKKPVSALLGPRVEAAKEHELLVAKSKAGSTYKHTAYSQPDLTDHRFGLLVVLQQGSPSTHGARRWLVRCACPRATEKLVITSNLVSGKTKSCGCLFTRLTHGQCGGHGRRASGAYVSWSRMLQR